DRSGMPCCPTKLKPDNWINVISLGGPVMAGAGASNPARGYRSQIMATLRSEFAGAGMGNPLVTGGAGSWWGAFCAAKGQAVYGEHLPGAIIFIDLAADDTSSTEEQVCPAIEGLVRSVWGRSPITDLVFLYGLTKDQLEVYRKGKIPPVVVWHEKIAEHYGIPSVNMGQYVAKKIIAGELSFEDFSKDGLYPTDRGHALYGEAIKPLIVRAKANGKPDQPPPKRVIPAPLTPTPMDKAQCVPYEVAKLDSKWRVGQISPVEPFRHVATSDVPGATLMLKFKGDQAGCFDAIGPDTGDIEFSIDGADWKLRPEFDKDCSNVLHSNARCIVQGLDPNQWHELRLRVAEKQPDGSKGRFIRIGVFLVNGSIEDPYAGMTPIQRLDAMYASMDQLKYTVRPDRWSLIPRTMQRLREGGTLKIVLLGDSIMNQTCHSNFDLLLQRMYPKVTIQKVASVRGSTGCWWYKDKNRVEDYVLKHKPDLLMIGGISQRDDVDSIREVIHQVRTRQQPEIMLLTPAFGFEGSGHITKWTYDIDSNGSDYRAKLMRLAIEEKCEFLDITGPWWQYVINSGKTYGWFRGDAVHANERGTQILARILEKYFAPKP
ncbi:MAG: SGNH/GDSL hydrolase family protein, partial [Kiritimatiellae bacterium]|nr:SGNH/GDSL hydrolase family protein [Kiritimatiellia bacterium]